MGAALLCEVIAQFAYLGFAGSENPIDLRLVCLIIFSMAVRTRLFVQLVSSWQQLAGECPEHAHISHFKLWSPCDSRALLRTALMKAFESPSCESACFKLSRRLGQQQVLSAIVSQKKK